MLSDEHPIDNPDLPSYQCADYKAQFPCWDFSADMATGIWAWYAIDGSITSKAKRYLPPEHKEPGQAYKNRLARSPFDERYKPAIEGFSGLLSNFILADETIGAIADQQQNVDQRGSSLKVFLSKLDEMALKFGHCFCLIDFPPMPIDEQGNPLIRDALSERQANRRPYLVAIDPRDILNWEVDLSSGTPQILQVTIRERVQVKAGQFGSQEEIRYRVLYPGRYEVYRLVKGRPSVTSKDGWIAERVEEGAVHLDRVPLVFYSATESSLFESEPPLLNIAELNLKLYQVESDYYEILHKCNLPTPVRKGMNYNPGEEPQPLVLGPNSFVDLPPDGDFKFAEPSGSAIASTRQAILDLHLAIDRKALDFMGGDGNKTATEVLIQSAQTQASLAGMAERKESAVQQILQFWAMWLNDSDGGAIEVNRDLLKAPATAQEIVAAFQAGLLSKRTAIEMSGIAKDADEELKRLDEEFAHAVRTQAIEPGGNSAAETSL
jgi:hypothetical protein